MFSCSLFNYDVINPEKSFIKLDKNDEKQSFTITVDEGCKSCGECIKACEYNALKWDDEDSRN